MTELGSIGDRPRNVGAHVTRSQDDALLMGSGTYVADIRRTDMAEIAVVRSTVPHGRVVSIDTELAREVPGVLDIITAADLVDVSPFPNFAPHTETPATFPLARDKVRYVGAPVACVLATDRYVAEDAAELVFIEYDELEPISSIRAAVQPDAPALYDDWASNKLLSIEPDHSDADLWIDELGSFRREYVIGRHTAMPIECRGAVAEVVDGRLTLWTTNQLPHIARTTLSYVLPLAERDIRVVAPYIGGAFGLKQHVYPEDVLVSWLAMRHKRPVRFVEDRAEHMIASTHARDNVITIDGAIRPDGTIAALKVDVLQDLGSAEVFPAAFAPALTTAGHMTGVYDIPVCSVSITAAVTNKTPSGSYRGFGVPEAIFALERYVDEIAVHVGVDRIELRRKMLVSDADLPYVTPSGVLLDSGSFRETLDTVVAAGETAVEAARRQYSGGGPYKIGVGYAVYREGTGPTHFGASSHWTGHESCSISIAPDGSVLVAMGVTDQGQGTRTFVETMVADALGVERGAVRVELGDTDSTPYGLGAFGSRQAIFGGGAILKAARPIQEKIRRIAGHLLEANEDDIVVEAGRAHVTGSETPSVTLADIATVATVRTLDLPPGVEPGLESTARYESDTVQHVPDHEGKINANAAYPNSAHGVVIRVDTETGEIKILDYQVAHDCGRLINPPIVEGQILGAVAQGIGGALYEDMRFDEFGQPVTPFMHYLVPSVEEMPTVEISHHNTPSPNTPLGIKGVGEGGCVGALAAIGNALADALGPGVAIDSTPLSPEHVRALVETLEPTP